MALLKCPLSKMTTDKCGKLVNQTVKAILPSQILVQANLLLPTWPKNFSSKVNVSLSYFDLLLFDIFLHAYYKGQLISKQNHGVIVFPKKQTEYCKDFCPNC